LSDQFDKGIQEQTAAEAPASPAAQAEGKPRPRRGRKLLLTAAILLCVLALVTAGLGVWGYSLTVSPRNLPQVYIEGVFVGGMTREETADALERDNWSEHAGDQLAVNLPAGAGFTVDYLASGAALSAAEAVDLACAYGHDGGVFQNLFTYVKNYLHPVDVAQEERPLDEAYIRARIAEGQKELSKKLGQKLWEIDEENETLVVVKGAGGVELDADGLYEAVVRGLRDGASGLDFDALRREPVMPDFAAILAQIGAEPADAYFTEEFDVVPEVIGCSFDTAEAARLWQATPLGDKALIPLTVTRPQLKAADLEGMLYCDLLGSMTTYYTWSTAERINNIQLVADKLDGLIMLPGEVFSYNDYVGQRTLEAGFKVAKAYADGQEVEAIGGGICQVSSTLYCATMYARLATVSRTNHYFKVGYLDYGLDATVSWGQPDFKFRNSRDYPIRIAAYTNPDDESLTIEIWGTDVDGCSVKLRHTASEVYDEEYPDVQVGWSIHTYGDVYDADGNYLDTLHENSGVYYFHDEDIDWPKDHDPNNIMDSFFDDYMNPT